MDNNEMLEVYLFEANSLLEELDEILINCEKQDCFDADSINTIFRIMHTIKGSSAMMDFNSIAAVSHKVEDLFAFVRDHGIKATFNGELFELMFQSADFLKAEISCVESNNPLSDNIGNFEAEITHFLKKISGNEEKEENAAEKQTRENDDADDSADASDAGDSVFTHVAKIFFDEDALMENLRALMLLNAMSDLNCDYCYVPEDLEAENAAEEISQNGFVLYFKSHDDLEKCTKCIEQFSFVKKLDLSEGDLAHQNDVEEVKAHQAEGRQEVVHVQNQLQSTTSLINVNLLKLDKLMDLMGEIVITESMVTSLPTEQGVDMDSFNKASRQLQKLIDELQEDIMSIRMVPVSSVFQKMRRIVRDMSKKLEKDVELILEGEDTEVDKTIVDGIGDPLMHLVRNAMDHGIESPEERIACGKPAAGRITLSAENTGGEILVSICDDGRGYDQQAILEKAKSRGLLKKPEEEYTAKEIYAFLMMPGFSTKEQVTEFSGRGVGMDVVKKNIEKAGGEVILDCVPGEGASVYIKIPLTLAIVNGMKILVGDSIFTIPINNIKQSMKVDHSNIIVDNEKNESILIRDICYPIIRLHRLYGIDTSVQEIRDGIILLVESSESSYCIFADALLGEQQVVIKPLPSYLNRYHVKEHGISGCAILGDGSISLILDILNLLKSS